MNQRIALFAGTFDPFTIGHYDIVQRGLSIFDKIVVAIGINDLKKTKFSIEERKRHLEDLYLRESRVEVITYNGLTADIAKEMGAVALLRGIRSGSDYEYERTLADTNRSVTGVDTFLLFTDPKLSYISSHTVRELISYGRDVSQMLPPGMKL